MASVVIAPEEWPVGKDWPQQSIFLAGGITGCLDWQTPVSEKLSKIDNLAVFNPRRLEWNYDAGIDSIEASRAQIVWEHKYLNACDTVLFWFPYETLCPIVLFEYGKYLIKSTRLLYSNSNALYHITLT